MNKTKGFLRISAVLSAVWVIYWFTETNSAFTGWGINDFLENGIAPVIVFWGIVWVIADFRDKDDKTEDDEQGK